MGRQSSVMISYGSKAKAAHSGEKKIKEELGNKKGAWSRDEDRKLTAYIGRYGIWNWNHMPKAAGLARLGKSCRLRWMNYLKPGVRHGNFSKQEEDTIIKWHQLLGNKWSTIASKLEGRTDNEIKNYWHTRIKKRFPINAAVHNPIMQHNNQSSLLNKVAHSGIIISQESLVNNNEAASDDHNTSSNSEDDQNSVTDNNNTSPCSTDTDESVWPLDYYSPPPLTHLLPNEFSAINEKLVAEDVLFEGSSSSSSSDMLAAEDNNIWELLPSLEDMLMEADPFIVSDTFTSPYSCQENLAANEYPFYDLWGGSL